MSVCRKGLTNGTVLQRHFFSLSFSLMIAGPRQIVFVCSDLCYYYVRLLLGFFQVY